MLVSLDIIFIGLKIIYTIFFVLHNFEKMLHNFWKAGQSVMIQNRMGKIILAEVLLF